MTEQKVFPSFGSSGHKPEGTLIGTVIVYDTKTGRIAHTHQFVHLGGKGAPPTEASMEKQALKAAASDSQKQESLAALHHGNVPLKMGTQYRVDLNSKKLVEVGHK